MRSEISKKPEFESQNQLQIIIIFLSTFFHREKKMYLCDGEHSNIGFDNTKTDGSNKICHLDKSPVNVLPIFYLDILLLLGLINLKVIIFSLFFSLNMSSVFYLAWFLCPHAP